MRQLSEGDTKVAFNRFTRRRKLQGKWPDACRRVHFLIIVAVCSSVFTITSCRHSSQSVQPALNSPQWREFQGTWTASGSRNSLQVGGDRVATISTLSGSLLLSGTARPAVGFRSEAVVFNDNQTGMIGRAVWTDENGDEAYSELHGEGTSQKNKITGTFVGGTGRYLGATGSYEFSWRFLVENEDGVVQGQSVGLNGKVRVDSDVSKSKGEPQS
jgi:hypothetical protein